MILTANHWRAATLGACLGIVAGCTSSPHPGFDGGPCTWSFPADDPCAASGLVCRSSTIGDPTTCQLPPELFRCSPTYGCNGPNLSCREVPVEGIGSAPLCVRSCAQPGTSLDCPDPFSFCQPLPDAGGSACLLASCLGAFQLASCQVGNSMGTCLPLSISGTPLAFCQAAGAVAVGGSCSLGGNYLPLCAQGLTCISQQCFQACERSASPACPSGTICSPPFTVAQSGAFFDGVYSLCLTPCSPDAGVGCTAMLTCREIPGVGAFCLP